MVDPSNGRIAMVMGNGANDGQTLIFDHMSRRSENSEGMDEYPQEVVRAHEEFSTRTTASSTAKVELLYGKKVHIRILDTMHCSILPL